MDKYMAALALFGFNIWSGAISIAVTGLFSIFTKNSIPILGALFGIALFLAVCFFSMTAFVGFVIVGIVLKLPDSLGRILLKAGYAIVLLGVPVVSFGFALFKTPKAKFQQSGPGYPPQGVGSPDP